MRAGAQGAAACPGSQVTAALQAASQAWTGVIVVVGTWATRVCGHARERSVVVVAELVVVKA
jgi:hypothetical protein